MANVYAIAAGTWSTAAIWNTGSLPTSSDDVYTNGFTVTIDQNIIVLSLRNQVATGIAGGGNFQLQAGKTVNANIFAGTAQCMIYTAGGTATINGNITGGSAGSAYGVNTNSSVLNVNGNVTGGAGTTAPGIIAGANSTVNITGAVAGGNGSNAFSAGVYGNASTSVINITGDVSASSLSYGVYTAFTATITINGNVTGGTGNSIFGVYINANGATVTINGNVTGGMNTSAYGLNNNGASTVTINGTAIGGLGAIGAVNVATGTMRARTAKGHDTAAFAGLHGSSQSGTTTWEKLDYGPNGEAPVTGYTKMRNVSDNSVTVKTDAPGTEVLVDSDDVANGLPLESDVREGVAYDFGNKTGTCAVPLPGQVLVGVAVDDTVGTALLTAAAVKAAVLDADTSTLTVINSIGERLKNCATVETTGTQIASLNP